MIPWVLVHWELLAAVFFFVSIWVARLKPVVVVARQIYDWLRFMLGRANRIETALVELTDVVRKTNAIVQKELNPNGGNSIRDIVVTTRDLAFLGHVKLQMISNHIRVGLYDCDANGSTVFANDTLCEMFGLSHEQMLGNGWLEAVAPPDRASTIDAWNRSVKENIPYSWQYNVQNRKTGRVSLCIARAQRVLSPSGKTLGFTGTCELIP